VKPVEFVFFDKDYVYSTSEITISHGETCTGPTFFGNVYQWQRMLHGGSFTLPNKEKVSVALMSFAAPVGEGSDKSFFVMPLPSYWQSAGVNYQELGLNRFTTGVFLHEFSHSQQMQTVGKKVLQCQQKTPYKDNFSDDIIQDLFSKDTIYSRGFQHEVELLYQGANASGKASKAALVRQGLQAYRNRQKHYFTGRLTVLSEVDDLFLTMEGLGQFSMLAWLMHPQGGSLTLEAALKATRRKRKKWSQDEGLALFLVLNGHQQPKQWAKYMFSSNTKSVIELIRR
jgi:hypothetical protein